MSSYVWWRGICKNNFFKNMVRKKKINGRSYMVRVSLVENINSPFIWFSTLPCDSREIVKLSNKGVSKSVWCEVVIAGDNFIERYNRNPRTLDVSRDESFVVVNEWYRKKLGLKENKKQKIEISTNSWIPSVVKQLLASYKHPDNSVRIAADLALTSVFLGFVGLFLGIVSL